MLVLALETATRQASVVLAEDDEELFAWRAETHQDLCRRLAGEIEAVLGNAGRAVTEVGLVAVGLGPGYFTALRVGLATAKGVALARSLPLVGVSSLAAMAWQVRHRTSGLVCPVIDAKRGEMYAACYRVSADGLEQVGPEVAAGPGDLAERLLGLGEPVTVFGQVDEAPVEALARSLGDRGQVWAEEVMSPDALAVAHLGRRQHAQRGGDDLASLRPIYVRKSYAEERFEIDLGLR